MITSGTWSTKIDSTINALELRGRVARDEGRKLDELSLECMLAYYRKLRSAKDDGKCIVAHSFLEPAELFVAMDIVPLPVEYIGTTVCHLTGGVEDAISAARSFGFRSEVCSIDRVLSGAYLLGWLPPPDAYVSSNVVCDLAVPRGGVIKKLFGCPTFNLDMPYHREPHDLQYYVEQMRELVEFLEGLTGRKMDWERLGEVIQLMRREVALIREIMELRKTVPSPIKGKFFQDIYNADGCMAGTPECVAFLEAARNEVRDRIERKVGAVKNERHRLLSIHEAPDYVPGLYDWMADQHGAVSVVETISTAWGELDLSIADPIEAVANKMFNTSVVLADAPPADFMLPRMIKDIEDYQVDGAILWARTGCPTECGLIKVQRDVIRNIGVPCLVLDCDPADATFSSEGEIKSKLEEFFERLDDAS